MTLSPLASRIVAWGLLANLLWATGLFLVAPLVNQIGEDREAISRFQKLLAGYRQLEANLASTQAQLVQFRERQQDDKYFLTSKSSALMAAELQDSVQKIVSGSGASLRSSRTVAPATEQGFDRLAVDLEFAASNSGLSTLLRGIALAEPSMLIDRILVQVPESGVTATAPDGQPSLTVTLRLVSYGRSSLTGAKP